jgi:hypothetical protein
VAGLFQFLATIMSALPARGDSFLYWSSRCSTDPRYAAKKARIEHLYAIPDREVAPQAGDPEVIFCVDLCRQRNYAEGLRCRL